MTSWGRLRSAATSPHAVSGVGGHVQLLNADSDMLQAFFMIKVKSCCHSPEYGHTRAQTDARAHGRAFEQGFCPPGYLIKLNCDKVLVLVYRASVIKTRDHIIQTN